MADKTPVTATVSDVTATPAKRGRKRVRDENGTDVRVFFSEDESKALADARWDGRYEKVADLVKEKTLQGIGYTPKA